MSRHGQPLAKVRREIPVIYVVSFCERCFLAGSTDHGLAGFMGERRSWGLGRHCHPRKTIGISLENGGLMSSTWRVSRPFIVVMAIIAGLSIGIGLNLTLAPVAQAQAGLSTGSIQGTILDPKGSSVPSARVSITSKGTGARLDVEVSPTGTYSSGPLAPGAYVVRVEAAGFKAVELPATVQVGNIANVPVTLEIGSENTVVTVEGTAVSVNTEQATIQG